MKKSGTLQLIKIIKIFKAYIKIDKKIIKFSDTQIEKHKFHQYKSPILINNIDINKIVVSNKVSFGFKYFIGYKDHKKVTPLCILLPELSAYRRNFDKSQYKMKMMKDDELLEKYNEIWKKRQQWDRKGI